MPREAVMTRNPLQFCYIAREPCDWRELTMLELGVGSRRIFYGPRIRPRIEIQDEHVEIELKEHTGRVLAALRLSDRSGAETRFITVGDDHRIVIWNIHGEVEGVLAGHTGRIGGVWELTGGRLASWDDEKSLFVWNTRGRGSKISRIKTTIRSPDRVFVALSGDFFCLTESWKARMVAAESGTELAVLNPQIETVTGARRLASGAWITQSSGGMKLWSSAGMLQRRFQRSFSLDDGYFDLPNGRLLVVDDQQRVELFDRHGARLGARDSDPMMATALRQFLRNRTSTRDAIAARPTFEHLEHRRSPLSEPAMPNDPPKKLGLAGARRLWDFFNRPDLKTVRSWKCDEVEAALDVRERVLDAIYTHQTLGLRATVFSLLGCLLFGVMTMCLFQSRLPFTIVLSLLGVLASSYLAIMHALEVFAMSAAERALTVLPREADALVSDIRAHRRRNLASFPFASASALYAGSEASDEIARMIAGPLRKTALIACGLRSSDIKTQDWKLITLKDWALPRHADAVASADVSWTHNLGSFWWTLDGAFVFAVQTIQYILPMHDKVDVFTVDYDFVARRAYNQTVSTFHYADVTNITVRELNRPILLQGVSANVGATEIALVLCNGKSISLTVLDGDSAVPLRRAVKSATGASLDEQRQNIQAELRSWEADVDHSAPERAMQLRSLHSQLAALQAESLAVDRPDPTRSRPDEVVAYLRSLILGGADAGGGDGQRQTG